MICKHILLITFLNEPDLIFSSHLNGFTQFISDVLLWTPAYGRAKVVRPARTYIQQLCEDTGCIPEDLPEAMYGKEKWRVRVRDIRASGTTWWWWYTVKPGHWSKWVEWGSIPGRVIKKWYLMPLCLALSTKRWGSSVKWSNPGNGVAPSPTHRCCSYWKGSLQVIFD